MFRIKDKTDGVFVSAGQKTTVDSGKIGIVCRHFLIVQGAPADPADVGSRLKIR